MQQRQQTRIEFLKRYSLDQKNSEFQLKSYMKLLQLQFPQYEVAISFSDGKTVYYHETSEGVPERMESGKTICARVVEAGHPLMLFGDDQKMQEFNLSCYLGTPIFPAKEDLAIGAVCMYHKDIEEFPESSKEFCQEISKMISFHISQVYRSRFLGELSVITEKASGEEISEAYLSREIQRMGKIGAWYFDVKSGKIFWSKGVYDIHKVPLDETLKVEEGITFYVEEDQERLKLMLDKCINENTPYTEDLEIIDRLGKRKWVRTHGEAVLGEDGELFALMGTFQDINYRKRLEMSLKQKNTKLEASQKQLKLVIETISDGIWDWDIEADYEYMSPPFWQMFGFEPKEKKHHPSEWKAIIFEEDLLKVEEAIERHIATLGKHPVSLEVRFRHKSGDPVWVLYRGQVVEWGEGGKAKRMIGSHTNITGLKMAQAQLQESAKYTALGEMAGGIAHEINNPLAIISSNMEALEMILNSEPIKKEAALHFTESVNRTVDRITKIVSGLRKISRRPLEEEVRSIAIMEIIEDVMALSKEKLRQRDVDVTVELDSTLMVDCAPVETAQILLNLVVNAYQALSGQPNAMVKIGAMSQGSHVDIYVQDNGQGIENELHDKIMMPFFTTKEQGEGTGLGLSISRELATRMGGDLFLDTSYKDGARFCLRLKAASQ